jgi:hypothetical protein
VGWGHGKCELSDADADGDNDSDYYSDCYNNSHRDHNRDADAYGYSDADSEYMDRGAPLYRSGHRLLCYCEHQPS